MSLIKIKCEDQVLHLVNSPAIFSGDVNYDEVTFEFCDNWTNFTKTAVFYNNKETPYMQILDVNNSCVIPKEVLTSQGYIYIGVFGVNGDVVITSQILKYRVLEGVPTENLEQPDPNPDILEQIVSDYNEVKVALDNSYQAFKEEVNEAIENKSDDTHTHDERYYTIGQIDGIISKLVESNRFAMVEGEATFDGTVKFIKLDYPTGFSRNNCVVIASMISNSTDDFYIVRLDSDKITLLQDEASATTREYKIVLFRI